MFFLFGSSFFGLLIRILPSIEQLLNQFFPVNQQWFSSECARPRFLAGAVRPKCQTSSQRAMVLKGPVCPISGRVRLAEAAEVWSSGTCCATSSQPIYFQVPSCHPRSEIVVWIGGYPGFRRIIRTHRLRS